MPAAKDNDPPRRVSLHARIDSLLKEDVRRGASCMKVYSYRQHHYWNQHDNATCTTAAGRERTVITKIACFHTRIMQRAAAAAAAAVVLSQKLTFSRDVANHSLTHSSPTAVFIYSTQEKCLHFNFGAFIQIKNCCGKVSLHCLWWRAPSNIGSCTSVCKRYTLLCALRTLHFARTTSGLGRSTSLSSVR
jgi:hypothetical protein